MVDARESMLGLSGGLLIIGALCFIVDFGPDDTFMFGMFSLTGVILMFVGILMRGHADPKNIRKVAAFVLFAGIIVFLASALIDWNPMELLMLVTCGAFCIIMSLLSLRLPQSE